MKSEIAEEIKSAFSGVNAPVFEKFLEGIMYVRDDQQPVDFAREIYPCSDLNRIDLYKLDEILLHLAPEAYPYVIPRILIYLLENESGMEENFYDTFLSIIEFAPEYQKLKSYTLAVKIEKFYSQLTPPQCSAIIAAYRYLSKKPDTDMGDLLVFQRTINFLTKMNRDMT